MEDLSISDLKVVVDYLKEMTDYYYNIYKTKAAESEEAKKKCYDYDDKLLTARRILSEKIESL